MLSRLFVAVLWSPARKGLTSWLLFVMFNCVFVTFPCSILGQVWYLIVSIPHLCRLSYLLFVTNMDIGHPVHPCTLIIAFVFPCNSPVWFKPYLVTYTEDMFLHDEVMYAVTLSLVSVISTILCIIH